MLVKVFTLSSSPEVVGGGGGGILPAVALNMSKIFAQTPMKLEHVFRRLPGKSLMYRLVFINFDISMATTF